MIKIAINGFGRIGRNILRAIYENGLNGEFEVVAINDLAPIESSAQLLKFDSTHGQFNFETSHTQDTIKIVNDTIPVYSQRDPAKLPWDELAVDVVMECTGFFRAKEKAELHRSAGAKKVLVSAPGKNLDKTVVYGVNDHIINDQDNLVSNASCTTNCLAHVAKAINDSIGIEHGQATTIHSYTNTQNLLDSYHKDPRRARAANQSMIPTTTGSAKAIAQVIPELKGKLNAVSVRVPTVNVSLLDFNFLSTRKVDIEALSNIFTDYADENRGVFDTNSAPLVSIDFNHNPNSAIIDLDQTRINGKLIKVMAWYDNEWAFSNRMIDTARKMMAAN